MASLNVIDKSNKKTSYIALKPLMHNVPKWSEHFKGLKQISYHWLTTSLTHFMTVVSFYIHRRVFL